jgi:SAM-dependent methyltransferase
MDASTHWNDVYQRKQPDQVSWYRPHLERSLAFVDHATPAPSAIIDVGGGASTFVDDLLVRGHRDLTVLDLSGAALDAARTRLGPLGAQVSWLEGDVTTVPLRAQAYDFWHDRAVFHFLWEPEQRARYVEQVRHAVRPGGHVLVATFGPAGPERCSGLDVMRYDADRLHAAFGDEFRKVESVTELHSTPWGAEQQFVYCYCRLAG